MILGYLYLTAHAWSLPEMRGSSGSNVSIVVALEWNGCIAPVDKTWSDLKSLFTYLPSTGIDVIQ